MSPFIPWLLATLFAVVAGILLLRFSSAKEAKSLLEQRNGDLATSVESIRRDLAQSQSESADRAGFQALALEREKAITILRDELQSKTDAERTMAARVKELEAELRNERQNTGEKIALLDNAERTLADKFEALANKVLDQKSKTFSEGNQKELGTLLEPLKMQIGEFRKKVEEAQSDSKIGVTELKTLIGTLGTLNAALTEEAHNLSTALRRDTKMQGNWGETILRNILEKSGLQEGLHFSFQQSFTGVDDNGQSGQRRQTDVVLRVPGERHLIIDSKVSLNAYKESVNSEDEKERAEALKRHLKSVRDHYIELAGRNYQNLSGIESPDFVVMFVPIEPAFLLALQGDENLWHDAYQKKVLLCGPTTVLFVIRIVADLWRQEAQARNVKEVMKRGALLYDKFVGFLSDMEKVGRSIQSAKDAHGEAMDKLSKKDGNLVGQVEKLRKLGVRSSKSIPANLLDGVMDDSEAALTVDGGENSNSGL